MTDKTNEPQKEKCKHELIGICRFCGKSQNLEETRWQGFNSAIDKAIEIIEDIYSVESYPSKEEFQSALLKLKKETKA